MPRLMDQSVSRLLHVVYIDIVDSCANVCVCGFFLCCMDEITLGNPNLVWLSFWIGISRFVDIQPYQMDLVAEYWSTVITIV